MHRHAVEYSTYPRGPRSGPGCSVPVRHYLIGLIHPTRRHIAISPHGGLYAMPSLCGSAEATPQVIFCRSRTPTSTGADLKATGSNAMNVVLDLRASSTLTT